MMGEKERERRLGEKKGEKGPKRKGEKVRRNREREKERKRGGGEKFIRKI